MADHITDKLVKGLAAPPSGNRVIYDGGHSGAVAGFGIRITAGGAKSFVLNYRFNGRERRYTIGTYGPNEWSVERARKRAGDLRRMLARGEDPLAQRIEQREAPTIAALCARFEQDVLPRKRPSTQADYRSIIKGIIIPCLGASKVALVRRADVDKMHRDLADTPYRANRALALLSSMFGFAVRQLEWRTDNPCSGIERFPEQKRTRYLAPDEIARLSAALSAYPDIRVARLEAQGRGTDEAVARERAWGQRAADAIRLCLLTGCRRGEALWSTWPQFDLAAGGWTKPASNTKQGKEHRVPLSTAAVSLLKRMLAEAPRLEDGSLASSYVFPGKTPAAPISELKDEWSAIRKAAGLPDTRLHDLRHTFASIAASSGASLPMIGALLGHSNPTTTHRYAHLFSDPLRKMADTVGAVVTGEPVAEVVLLETVRMAKGSA